jgi:hypothetical protein
MFNLPLALFLASALAGQQFGDRHFASPVVARELAYLLRSAVLQAFAAPDPRRPGAFVAALYVPEQLMVVEAYHPAKAAFEGRIAAGQFREAYLDLQSTPTPEGRFYVLDANANGLLTAPPGRRSVDMLDDGVQPSLLLNGDLQGQGVSAAEYQARVMAADAKYAELLRVLIDALKDRPPHRASPAV